MIEHGHGPALVLIPGLPGPSRYVAPTTHALSTHFHVLTFSLGRECTIEADVDRIVEALNERHLDRAVICGISLGGLVALRFAAMHPDRTTALVLASTPGPGASLSARHRLYTRFPWVFGPFFLLEMPFRLWRELDWSRMKTLIGAIGVVPVSFGKIARRAELIESTDIASDCRRVTAPTLIVTGEQRLDNVVPVENTLNYVQAIQGAAHVVLEDTGHLGAITQSRQFAEVVHNFVKRTQRTSAA